MVKSQKKIKIVLAALSVVALSIALLLFNANRIIKYELERRLGRDFSVGRISAGPGGVDAYSVKLSKEGEVFFEADRLKIKAGILGFLKKNYSISSIVLNKPVIRFRTDKEGRLINPFAPSGGKVGKREAAGEAKDGKDAGKGGMPPFEIKQIIVNQGRLFYYDGKVSTPPHLTRLDSIDLELKNISFPPSSRQSDFILFAQISGKAGAGILKSSGRFSHFRHYGED